MSTLRDLSSPDVAVVCAALARMHTAKPNDAELAAVEARLSDMRVHEEGGSWPSFRTVAELAIGALVATGPRALPILERATELDASAEVPEPAYDQGVYIGCYSNRVFTVRAAAVEAIKLVGRQHAGSIAWVGMTPWAWDLCGDPKTMLRAVFDRNEHSTLREYVRRFLVATCARSSPEVAAAIDVAERAAFGGVTCDQITAARAAARHAGAEAVALALELDLDIDRALRALALVPKADADLLRATVPFVGKVEKPTTPPMRAPWDPLLDAVIANLDDDAPRLAFAKWLSERGDPRGEYITLQCANGPRARQTELITAHKKSWTRWDDVTFERGFAECVAQNLAALRHEPTARDVNAYGVVTGSWLDALVETSAVVRVRRLTIFGAHFRPYDLENLCRSQAFMSLREVTMRGCDLDMKCVELLATWRALGQLTRLDLTANGLPPEARKLLPACAEL